MVLNRCGVEFVQVCCQILKYPIKYQKNELRRFFWTNISGVNFTINLRAHLRQYSCTKKSSNLKCKYKRLCAKPSNEKVTRKRLVKLTPSLYFISTRISAKKQLLECWWNWALVLWIWPLASRYNCIRFSQPVSNFLTAIRRPNCSLTSSFFRFNFPSWRPSFHFVPRNKFKWVGRDI